MTIKRLTCQVWQNSRNREELSELSVRFVEDLGELTSIFFVPSHVFRLILIDNFRVVHSANTLILMSWACSLFL